MDPEFRPIRQPPNDVDEPFIEENDLSAIVSCQNRLQLLLCLKPMTEDLKKLLITSYPDGPA